MNLPNKITIIRILIVPIFLIFAIPMPEIFLTAKLFAPIREELTSISIFLIKYGKYIAAIIFIIASSTDGVDGYIARKRKQITALGQFLDPIADKLLVTAALVALIQRNELTAWVAIIIIGRDLIVTGLRLVAAAEGKIIAASIWGKIKTITQMVAIVAVLTDNFPLSYFTDFNFNDYAMIIAVIATVYSGVDYIVKNKNVLKI
ncbi:MAG: CDP-diacylglycerol--glycerol-3-phosphate 3-phosphatidyltransferase [Eubacteriales bacterium]|nr:CDP-diacylglycerol--glycerol-3-phosphate 3-phosphatidyltransferase [Eubacteriales bacterium]